MKYFCMSWQAANGLVYINVNAIDDIEEDFQFAAGEYLSDTIPSEDENTVVNYFGN